MIPFLGAVFLVIGFVILMHRLRLVPRAHEIIAISHRALQVMGDPMLDDDAKERQMQSMAITLFQRFLIITLGGACALLLPVTAIWALDQVGLISLQATLEVSLSWSFLAGTCVLAMGAIIFSRKKQTESPISFQNKYSLTDKLLHRLAFATTDLQTHLAELEDRLFRTRLAKTPCDEPVFITALPRAGTTLLLELFVTQPEFASHSYRQMPVVLLPMIWQKFVRAFRTDQTARERAHGDGMMVDLDSPEAFEEMVWMAFWRQHYGADRIIPWDQMCDHEGNSAFDTFLGSHMRKIIAASSEKNPAVPPSRYISKNNLNIARLPYLRRLFPKARLLVPFRSPLQQAASLHRQHLRFLEIHKSDPFAREYMAGIGHLDFGANLRPVDFTGWLDTAHHQDATKPGFWVEYWVATYNTIAGESTETISLVDFDSLCISPEAALRRIADYVGVSDPDAFLAQQNRVHPPAKHSVDVSQIDPALLQQADDLSQRLRQVAL